MFGLTLFVFLVLAIAVQPAIAQQDQAPHVYHRGIPAGDTCSSCHKVFYDQWKASPHGANGVECTVCHGETTSPDFAGRSSSGCSPPDALSTCQSYSSTTSPAAIWKARTTPWALTATTATARKVRNRLSSACCATKRARRSLRKCSAAIRKTRRLLERRCARQASAL